MQIIFFLIIGFIFFLWFKRKKENNYNSNVSTSTNLELQEEEYRIFSNGAEKGLTLEQAVNKIEIVIQKDDFEGTTLIHFNNVTQHDYKYLPMYFEEITDVIVIHTHIGISFSIFQDNIYLDVYSIVQEMGLAKGDQLILLFENGEKIDIKFAFARSSGYMKSNSYQITEPELKIFIDQNLDKWKLISSRKNLYIVGDNSIFHERCEINNKLIAQGLLKYMAKTILFYKLNQKHHYSQDRSMQ